MAGCAVSIIGIITVWWLLFGGGASKVIDLLNKLTS